MNLQDLDALAKGLAPVVTKLVSDATAPLLARIAALEAAAPEPGAKGDPGADGRDGKDAEPISGAQIADAVAAYFDANPIQAGKDGRDGVDGKDGESVTLEHIEPLIATTVERAFAAIPVPQDGRDGVDGKDGRDGVDGQKGEPGRDGVGLAGALIDRSGALVVTLTDGSQRELGPVIGKDGEPGPPGVDGKDGRDGIDGLGFEDLDLTFDGERKLIATFTRGEISKAVEIEFPVVLHRGVYKAEAGYVRGDSVTWAGSSWIARRDAGPGEKPEGSDAWLLSVKRGRDGRDGKDGERGERGLKGDPGLNGRSYS